MKNKNIQSKLEIEISMMCIIVCLVFHEDRRYSTDSVARDRSNAIYAFCHG